MTEIALEPKPSDAITVIEGFDTMRVFLATVWQRQGKAAEDIASILGRSNMGGWLACRSGALAGLAHGGSRLPACRRRIDTTLIEPG